MAPPIRRLLRITTVAGLAACGARANDWTPAAVGAATFEVNPSTRGMTSRVRWMLAPDSSALLVMDDPVAVENDATPDGLLFATERTGRVFRMDSVWSAAPSPDWRRLAIGRGVVVGGGEARTMAPERWAAPAARLRAIAGAEPALVAESLRAHSFPVSGMAAVEGVAITLVADVEHTAPAVPITFVALDGWRVRWSRDGADLLVGTRPVRVQDDVPSADERRVPVGGVAPSGARAADEPRWIGGPTLGIGTPMSTSATRPLAVRGRTIEVRDGRIVVRERDSDGRDAVRDVGPGIPLAATRGGHFVLAVAPRPDRRPHESADRTVVYRVP